MITRVRHWWRAVWARRRRRALPRPPVRFYRGGQTGLDVIRRGLGVALNKIGAQHGDYPHAHH